MHDRKLYLVEFTIGNERSLSSWQIWHYTPNDAQEHVQTYAAKEYGVEPDDIHILSVTDVTEGIIR